MTEVICTLVANELIHDGDTVQIGLGSVFLSARHVFRQ